MYHTVYPYPAPVDKLIVGKINLRRYKLNFLTVIRRISKYKYKLRIMLYPEDGTVLP